MLNPLLNLNLPLTLSAKIVSIFKSLPISYPITIPPMAGARIKSIFLNFFLIFLLKDKQSFYAR